MKKYFATAISCLFLQISIDAEEEHRFAPDHLEPIDPFEETGYDLAVYQSLIVRGSTRVWMISRPSFDVESAVAIESTPIIGTEPDPFGGGGFSVSGYNYFVSTMKPKRKIWQSKKVSAEGSILDIQPTNDKETTKSAIPESAVNVIVEAWRTVLDGTRYVSEDYRGLDGITFQFGEGTKTGEVWSPDGGPPLQLVKLGNLLQRFVEDDEADREEILREVVGLANSITSSSKRPEQNAAGQPATRSESK